MTELERFENKEDLLKNCRGEGKQNYEGGGGLLEILGKKILNYWKIIQTGLWNSDLDQSLALTSLRVSCLNAAFFSYINLLLPPYLLLASLNTNNHVHRSGDVREYPGNLLSEVKHPRKKHTTDAAKLCISHLFNCPFLRYRKLLPILILSEIKTYIYKDSYTLKFLELHDFCKPLILRSSQCKI